MDLGKSGGLDLLPKAFPRREWPGWLQDSLLAGSLRDLPTDQQRTIEWTIAIQTEFEARELWRNIPGYRLATVGFADPDEEDNKFGVFIYTDTLIGSIGYSESRSEPLTSLDIDGWDVPVFLRPATWVFHGPPSVQPVNGTATCWAQSQKTTAMPGVGTINGKLGILTAKHVVSNTAVGSTVPLFQASGTKTRGTLLDLGPEGIDAALIEVPSTTPSPPLTPLNCLQFVAQWIDVTLQGTGGDLTTKVIEVQLGRGSLSPSIPLRVFLNDAGQSGDSGALVVDNQGNGIGLYMGELRNLSGRLEGFCQHLAQVTNVMNLSPFV